MTTRHYSSEAFSIIHPAAFEALLKYLGEFNLKKTSQELRHEIKYNPRENYKFFKTNGVLCFRNTVCGHLARYRDDMEAWEFVELTVEVTLGMAS